MSTDIDWNKAPEGATHYDPGTAYLRAAWCKKVDSGWMFWVVDVSNKWYYTDKLPSNAIARPTEWGGTGLTEALRQYQHNDGCGLVFGYDKLLVDQYVARLVEALETLLEVRVVEADVSYGRACAKAEQALAAYRKQGR